MNLFSARLGPVFIPAALVLSLATMRCFAQDDAAAPSPAMPADTAAAPAESSGERGSASAAEAAPEPQQQPPGAAPTIPVQLATSEELPPASAPAPTPAKDEHVQQLEDIVVTATKREKSVREIPASINALPGEELERQGVQGVEDIARLVPGVNITQPGDNAQRITIRGIAGQSSTNATTGVLFGDISFTDAYLPRVNLDPNPFDLQSVEVLKGPQGTLFGAGALNGAIRYVPQPPAYGVWETKYFLQYTQLSDGGAAPIFGAMLNAPIGSTTALRLVGLHRQSPGWIDNTRSGVKDANQTGQQGVRGILGWQPDNGWHAQLLYAWQDTTSDDTAVADNINGELKADNRPRLSPAHNVYHFGDLRLGYDFSWARFVAETGYIKKRAENNFDASSRLPAIGNQPTFSQDDTSHSQTWSQELRLQSPDDPASPWQWVTGLFAWRQDLFYHLDLPVETPALPFFPGLDLLGVTTADGRLSAATLQTDVGVKEYAWFFDVTRTLWHDFELSAGGRLYRTTSGGQADQQGLLLLLVNQNPHKVISGTLHEQGFNPKVSLLWHATHDILGYAALSKGFRVGGVQPGYNTSGAPPPDFFKSDTLWNYEGGVRTQWLDKTLRLDVTGYYVTWKNPQTFQLAPSPGLGSYLDNVGGAKGHGIEAALQYRAPFGLLFNMAAAWNNTVTTKDFVASDNTTVKPGAQWPFAPHWQTNTSLMQVVPAGNWLGSVGVSHLYLSKAKNNVAPSQNFDVFGYQQWDAQLGLSNPAIAWMPELSLIGNNLTNTRGITNYWSGLTATDASYIRPRALTLRISGKF